MGHRSTDPHFDSDRIVAAFAELYPTIDAAYSLEVVWEHNQWWVLAVPVADEGSDPDRIFSVVDAAGPADWVCDGLAFEELA